ncbi:MULTISPECIES: caspase family protein [unclassified Streptomyces]|uniref:wHTH domain-containing protein n=1 Tax=unclassified Streptomyces TaxID=2593676 RepID=UPI000B500412|nr:MULTISPECIES: caspase family protein [unclassified Streptomyces]MYW99476.1 hypothetical protein [Streptomyces sp. SID8378]SNB88127.1 Molecular chaperone, HSP90 family [Streptomyces sp. PgraA7]
MSAHRALLLFVPRYRSPDWDDLDFLEGEYADLRATLQDRGYEIDEDSTCDPEQLTRSGLMRRANDFIKSARPGEHLVVYFSGHGFHHHHRSYFAAHDSDPDIDNHDVLESGNIPFADGWAKAVDQSRAEKVLFVVDACRERLVIDRGSPQSPFTTPPDTEKFSYLMACEPEAMSAYTGAEAGGEVEGGPGGEGASKSFSLLTRALRDILHDVHGELPTDRLHELLGEEMEDLQQRVCDRLPRGFRQEPRLSGERGRQPFPFLPTGVPPERERLSVLRDHAVWTQLTGQPDQQMYRDAEMVTVALGERLAKQRREQADDPWLDWEADQRASRWVSFLIRKFLPDERFSAAEAVTISLAPMIHHAYRVQRSKELDFRLGQPADATDPWDKYTQLLHRTAPDREPRPRSQDHRTVRAWILHQEFYRLGEDTRSPLDGLTELVNQAFKDTWDLAEVLDAELLAWIFRAMQYGGSVLGEYADAPPDAPPQLRRRLVGYLLAAGHAMALDVSALPRVLVEHIGGPGRASLLQTRKTIAQAAWQEFGHSLRLSASCGHQAVMVALQEQAAYLDGLLHHASTQVRTGGGEDDTWLAALPHRASGDDVLPERDAVTGALKFLPVATRFGLDGTRVRDLLTGEQLYRDRRLAVRELYQNAMDACAVRDAREQYRPPPPGTEPWSGEISITQGGTGSRPYLECVDNGSGMDRDELLYAFAQGGARLSHLASFRQEQFEWQKNPQIRFHRNSRFGIGVLSYFMLADEIEVTTRKFRRDRSPGELLRVTVFGPDDLFQVDDHLEEADFLGEPCGTRVRLYLDAKRSADVSCVQTLRDVLGVARYRTTAVFQADREIWEPEVYRPRGSSGITASGHIEPDPRGDVFWCERGGAVLVDGVHVHASWPTTGGEAQNHRIEINGAVVNLRGVVQIPGKGKVVPRLSVERAQVLDDVTKPLANRLRRAVGSLIGSSLLTEEWLLNITHEEPAIADVIVGELTASSAHLTDEQYPMARTGFFPGDAELRAAWTAATPPRRITPNDYLKAVRLPEHLALWRYAAHFPAEVAAALDKLCPAGLETARLLPAVPSHALILGFPTRPGSALGEWDPAVRLGNLVRYAERLRTTLEDVEGRLAALHLSVEDRRPGPAIPLHTFLQLISSDGDGSWPWLEIGDAPAPYRLLASCDRAGLALPEVIRRFASLGYAMESSSVFLEPGSEADRTARLILSAKLDGQAPWLRGANVSHIRAIAERLDIPIPEAREKLKALGIDLSSARHNSTNRQVVQALQSLSDEFSSRSAPNSPVTGAHALYVAQRTGLDISEAVSHLSALGYAVPDDIPSQDASPYLELLLARRSGSDHVDPARPVPLPLIHTLAKQFDLSMGEVAERLRALDLTVPFQHVPDTLTEKDLVLLSKYALGGLGRSSRWLDPSRPVPPAHSVLAAATLGLSTQQAIDALRELGMRVTPLPAGKLVLGSENKERQIIGQWIPYSRDQTVPWGHVLYVADRLGMDVPTCLEYLSARGLDASAAPAERDGFDNELDLALVREVHGPAFDRLRMNTDDVINAAQAVGRSVADVRCRLSDLGAALTSTMTNAHFGDAGLLQRFVARPTPVEPGETVSAAEVHIVASENFLTVEEASDRLVAAGLTIQDTDYPRQRPTPEELLILRENGSALNNWIDLDKPVGLEHLLVTAHRLGTTVSGVAERLRSFGLDVPDTQAMVTRAWDRVPRR